MKKLFVLAVAVIGAISVCAQFTTHLSVWVGDEMICLKDLGQIDSITFVKAPKDGVLPGEFSVGASDKVHFSQGNLQYLPIKNTWRFAPHQYDTLGVANTQIAADYAGWIDLFGWGTGNRPTKASNVYGDYSSYAEWGDNDISNGGAVANTWRTLSGDEWNYLFTARDNHAELYGYGNVEGVNGLIILPDEWTTPDGLTFKAAEVGFGRNEYTVAQWIVMETAGAVFLPAAGDRYQTNVGNVGKCGYYWSCTKKSSNFAYSVTFSGSSLTPKDENRGLCNGFAVRLVR